MLITTKTKEKLAAIVEHDGLSWLASALRGIEHTVTPEIVNEWIAGKHAPPRSLRWSINYFYGEILREKGIIIHKCGSPAYWVPRDKPNAEYHHWECEKCGPCNPRGSDFRKSPLRKRMERIASKAFPDESLKTTAMIDKFLVAVCAVRGGCKYEIIYGYKKKMQKGYWQDFGYEMRITGPCKYCEREAQ